MTQKPYHKYVFDANKRAFVGEFEKMYQNEDIESYDSWDQEDTAHLTAQISALIINRRNFRLILDIGCGKGCFASILKKDNNRIVGVDVSQTAIGKAKAKYKDIEFLHMTAGEALDIQNKWDLILLINILSYLENWKKIIEKSAKRTAYLYVLLYLPPDPIGFVKNFDELKREISKHFTIDTELLLDGETIFILCKSKKITTKNRRREKCIT